MAATSVQPSGLAPPKLKRSNLKSNCYGWPKVQTDSEAEKLSKTVLRAYDQLPKVLKGPAIVLPGEIVCTPDHWRDALNDELMDRCESGLYSVQAFSLEDWLVKKVRLDGSSEQQKALDDLIAALPPLPSSTARQELAEDFYSSELPSDIMNVVNQPLVEVSTYRDIAEAFDTDQEDDDKDDAP
uniref:Uncharacterized protein n=1 Tax=Aureoumbra lagunensis TaxID=44058 RepID=A0A7S3NHJ8_9STRA|mmetsp:Transcript_19579/g.25343  ORF Transcript_19579/g.25343 Transcript_19579/m.25343 type:complete len:184 (+) Transcript_19579:145-696(+)|eukprot:CAMPEP_0197289322 /NCGR_PEP_ID=MMETSP0890-20130614/6555_1 /TAXON_ID=44058 ORGANISM="Aureoumbra lagunensis, Strain CCMP1510" /NCGR_SAMPLE_ID=MMETSP0890 /ASSEMBLY_ACC=CAM_ASM_000533 /LENGTH=183 /DNA_ID=CAMNT_0042760647 /DNA_START=157 /DNA_END=708 /DNA_ORIENTATION=+